MKKVIGASRAVALAAKICKPKVVAAYPITPQTLIVENLAEMASNGEMQTELIEVESEHSAMSACIGAQATGVRTFTSTSSQGLALMHEMLFIASGLRLPIVMAVANRALSAPINIWNDMQDSISERDSGWIQFYVDSGQEALDTILMAYKIAENKNILLPAMVCLDGFTLTHVFEPVDIPEQKEADTFLPEYKPLFKLDSKKPITMGAVAYPNSYMEIKHAQNEAMYAALEEIKKIHAEFSKKFKRAYGNGLIQMYKMEDAEYALIGMGTLCSTAREVIDALRKEGKKVGLIKIKTYRPFPAEDIIKYTDKLKAAAVIDRDISLGQEGALYTDVKAALQGKTNLIVNSFIAGLGGRDIKIEHIRQAFDKTISSKKELKGWLF